ncbi:hypothetical protein C7H19_09840 [Aphanothece hegewaldii CCALA 016]|uniref:PEP-CTERM sorting domain-containing protein n=1 Tax=Aphanothece hegewaldii CCALA 016 TaxID=2107694 RepID=A0A2T1LYI4_9CHRO|nr:PEP-CTERM sorting domain-containing protein [Aphanothece hegewaldii]PSF37462.1 hypothetical protein C7H19_09840 [Aphanothece hegewaldii CCALA 016]
MNQKNVLLSTVLSMPLVFGATEIAQAAIVQAIDPLTAVQTVTRNANTPGPTNNDLNVSGGTIFGNNITRRLSMLKQSGTGPGGAEIPTANFGAGLDYSNNAGVNSKLTVAYRGTLPSAKFAPIDLTVGGLADRVALGVILNDVALGQSTTFSVTLGSGTTVVTKNISSNVDFDDPLNPLPIEFLFSTFTGVNPAAINTFSIMIDPPANGDVSLKFLGVANNQPYPVVPEPASILGLLAVAGAASTVRKKNS